MVGKHCLPKTTAPAICSFTCSCMGYAQIRPLTSDVFTQVLVLICGECDHVSN